MAEQGQAGLNAEFKCVNIGLGGGAGAMPSPAGGAAAVGEQHVITFKGTGNGDFDGSFSFFLDAEKAGAFRPGQIVTLTIN